MTVALNSGWMVTEATVSGEQQRSCEQRMVRAHNAEEVLGDFLQRLNLPDDWRTRVLELVNAESNQQMDVAREKTRIEGQLARLKRLFVLGDLVEEEYRVERDRLRARLAALRPPMMVDLEKAAQLLGDFGRVWDVAKGKERRQIVQTLLNAVYLDSGKNGPIVAVEPKPEFAPLFELIKKGSPETDSGLKKKMSPAVE